MMVNLESKEQDELNEIVNNTVDFIKNEAEQVTLSSEQKIIFFEDKASAEICNNSALYQALKNNQNIEYGPGSEPWRDSCNTQNESMIGSEDWWDKKS